MERIDDQALISRLLDFLSLRNTGLCSDYVYVRIKFGLCILDKNIGPESFTIQSNTVVTIPGYNDGFIVPLRRRFKILQHGYNESWV